MTETSSGVPSLAHLDVKLPRTPAMHALMERDLSSDCRAFLAQAHVFLPRLARVDSPRKKRTFARP